MKNYFLKAFRKRKLFSGTSTMSEDIHINVDYILIPKFLNREADLNESNRLNNWINASAGNKQEFERLKQAWEYASVGIGLKEWNVQKSKEQFLLKVIQTQVEAIQDKEETVKRSRKLIRNIWKYAAMAFLVIGLSGVLVYQFQYGKIIALGTVTAYSQFYSFQLYNQI